MRLYLIIGNLHRKRANDIAENELNGGKDNLSVHLNKKGKGLATHYGASLWISENLKNQKEIIERVEKLMKALNGETYFQGQEITPPEFDENGEEIKQGEYITDFDSAISQKGLKRIVEDEEPK